MLDVTPFVLRNHEPFRPESPILRGLMKHPTSKSKPSASDDRVRFPPLAFDPPAELAEEEWMSAWRVPYQPALKEPRALQPQLPVRPNLIVHRRRVDPDQEVQDAASVICEQLMKSIEGLSEIAVSELAFQDGVTGLLLEFSFPATSSYKVVQLEALRIDAGVLTTLTYCTEMTRLTPEEHRRFSAFLSSATVPKAEGARS
jgi:hypothetical protein